MKPYAHRADELKRQQAQETEELRERQAKRTAMLLEEMTGDLSKLSSARGVLFTASALEAPRAVVDALCKWIGDLEKAARNVGLLTEESC